MDIFDSTTIFNSIESIFDTRKVSTYDLQRLMDTSTWAPSPFNSQPWEFIIIQDDENIRKIAKIVAPMVVTSCAQVSQSSLEKYIANLPNIMVYLNDISRQDPGRNYYKLGYISMGAALANIIVSAPDADIGLQPICLDKKADIVPKKNLRSHLNLSENLHVCCLFGLGYLINKAASTQSKKSRVITIHDNVFGKIRNIGELVPNIINRSVFSLIKSRRSYRKDFLKKDLRKDDEERIVKAARDAFDFQNKRIWELVFVKDRNVINDLADLLYHVSIDIHLDEGYSRRMKSWMRYSKKERTMKADGVLVFFWNKLLGFVLRNLIHWTDKMGIVRDLSVRQISKDSFADLLKQAALVIVISYDKAKLAGSNLSYELNLMNLGIVIQNILLTATSLEMGVQFQSIFMDTTPGLRKLREILSVPDQIELIEVLRLGYMDPEAKNKLFSISSDIRRPIEKIVHREYFQKS